MKSLIIVGPSGVGKGTVISQLLKKYSIFEFVVSFTTRHPRPGEIEGKDYYFISHQEFNQRKENGEMLENKKVFTNYYGTSRSCYFEIIKRGRIPLLDVDIEGMKDIRMRLREEKQKEEIVEVPEVLCLMPPSWKILEERLSKRGT
jgi:guanylate kinase